MEISRRHGTTVLAGVAVVGVAVAAWTAGSFGYGLSWEHGGPDGGLWQLDGVLAVVLGTVLAGILELVGGFVAERRGIFRWAPRWPSACACSRCSRVRRWGPRGTTVRP